jgi:hypothetical protein
MSLKSRVFLARNDQIDAMLAAASLESAVNEGEGFQYIASVAIRPQDWDVAHAIGLARTSIAKANSLNSSKFRRGENDERIDTEGALGEWLVATLLAKSGAEMDVAAFVEYKAPKGEVDLVLAGQRIDVKTIGQAGGRNCNINREQHFAKKPAAYLVVHLVSGLVADLYVVRAAELEVAKENGGRWQLRQGWSPYYNAYMPKQLANLEEPETAAA